MLSCLLDMTEILCDGMPAVINGRTGEEYSCTKGSDCPADSYCINKYVILFTRYDRNSV